MARSITERLCDRIVALRDVELAPAVQSAAVRLLLDGLAVGVAGSREPAVALLAEHHRSQGSFPQATILGRDLRLGTVAAAAVNGAAMHVLDFEPMWSPANHALSTTLPAVLALAEGRHVTGGELLAALVAGVEIQGWLRQASGQWEAQGLAFHPPGMVGPIGAAVAAGQLLGLSAGPLRCAIGLAASRCGGLMANIGTMTKATHCGQAAASGLEAALLAASGFSANADIFEADQSYAAAFSPQLDAEQLLRFGPPYRLVEPGYAIKMFPCQYGTHFGITAALTVRAAIGDPRAIEAVRLRTPIMAYVDRPQPETGLAGKFSLQYTLAVALLDGFVGLASFSEQRRRSADVQRLLPRVELTMSADIPGNFEAMHVELEVDSADGSTHRARCDGPAGRWGAAPIEDSDHRRKVEDCLSTVLPAADIDALLTLAQHTPDLDAADLRRMIALTAGPAQREPAGAFRQR